MTLHTTKLPFTKMHGAGNDYVYVDCFSHDVRENHPLLLDEESPYAEKLAIFVSNRNNAVGSDGLILICPTDEPTAAAKMRMYNADGSLSQMCGNGLRCVAKYIYDHRICHKNYFIVETGAGLLAVEVFTQNGENNEESFAQEVRISVGKPTFTPEEIPTTLDANTADGKVLKQEIMVLPSEFTKPRDFLVTCVAVGNPHCVIFLDEELTDDLVWNYGKALEQHAVFPERVNVEFIRVHNDELLEMRVWERGSGETLACGTGATAAVIAAIATGEINARQATVQLLGGDLEIAWHSDDAEVFLTGPAVEVFSGELNVPDLMRG